MGLGAGTVFDRPRPKTALRVGNLRAPLVLSLLISWLGSEGIPLGKAKGTGRVGFVTTVDQSDIRGLVTDMSLIRQGLPLLYELASITSCDRLKGGPRIPPTVLPTRPVPFALSVNLSSYRSPVISRLRLLLPRCCCYLFLLALSLIL